MFARLPTCHYVLLEALRDIEGASSTLHRSPVLCLGLAWRFIMLARLMWSHLRKHFTKNWLHMECGSARCALVLCQQNSSVALVFRVTIFLVSLLARPSG